MKDLIYVSQMDTLDLFKSLSREISDKKSCEKVAQKGAVLLIQLKKEKDKVKKAKLLNEFYNIAAKYKVATSLDSYHFLLASIDEQFIPLAIEMAKQMTDTYGICTPQDKAYLQIAISAFCRYQSNSFHFEKMKKIGRIDSESRIYMDTLSRDIDRAYRQYNSVIQYFTLRSQNPLKLIVKAKNIFMAQNQQNNSNPNQNENNE